MIITDAVFAVVECAIEVGCSCAGVSEQEKAAIDAAMLAVAASTGAAAVATANAAQLAMTVANKVMDEAGVATDSPLRQAVDTSLRATATVCGGAGSAGSIASACVQVAADGTAMGLEAADVEGGAAVKAVSSVVSVGEGGALNVDQTAFRTVGAAATSGVAAAAASGGDDKEMAAAAKTGLQIGSRVGALTSDLSTGLANESGGDGPTAEARAEALSGAKTKGIDIAVGGIAAVVANEAAKKNGQEDVNRSISLGLGVQVGSMARGAAWSTEGRDAQPAPIYNSAVAVLRLTEAVHRIQQYADLEARANLFAKDEPELAAAFRDRVSKPGGFEGRPETYKALWESSSKDKDAP